MPSPITQSNNRLGLCPHGLVPSACPVCSGASSSNMKASNKFHDITHSKVNNNEWSWLKCYAQGLYLKAQKVRAENNKTNFERQIEFANQLNKNILLLRDKIISNLKSIQNSASSLFSNAVNVLINGVNFVFNIISKLPQLIKTFARFQNNIQNFINAVFDKLVAIMGDIKSFFKRKIFEDIKLRAKKLFMFFNMNTEDENYKNDDTLAVFKSRELKKLLKNIITTVKNRKKNGSKQYKTKI